MTDQRSGRSATVPPERIAEACARLEKVVETIVALKKQNGLLVGLCPFHNEKTGSFTVYSDHYYCFGCNAHGDAIDFVRATKGLHFADAVDWIVGRPDNELRGATKFRTRTNANTPDEDADRKREGVRRIWREAGSADDTLVETYLRERGIRPPIPPSLRYAHLQHGPTGLMLPAMVGAVQAPDRSVTGMHRTFLTMDGTKKAPVSQNKMMLGKCAGGAVRLAAVAEKLALAEGIETGLSILAATNISTWATLSTSGLKAVILPDEVREVIICADGDEVGEKAANDAAQRFLREGRVVRIARAPAGMDFNDLLVLPENVVPLDVRKREPAHG